MLDPRRRLELRVRIAHQVALLARPRTPHYLPRIARQVLAMNDKRSDCALPRRFFKLVRPSPVIGQRVALEEIGILRRRLIHDHQHHLAADIHALVVVPVVFGRMDAVTHKYNRRVDLRQCSAGLIIRHELRAVLQRQRLATLRHELKSRLVWHRAHGIERHLLVPRAVVSRRLQSIGSKLFREIFRRHAVSFGTRTAPLQLVIRQVLHRCADPLRIDMLRRLLRPRRYSRHLRHRRQSPALPGPAPAQSSRQS